MRRLLTERACRWLAWHVSVILDLKYPLRWQEVRDLLEPSFSTRIEVVLERQDPELHHLIVRSLTRELRFAGHWPTDQDPPPIITTHRR